LTRWREHVIFLRGFTLISAFHVVEPGRIFVDLALSQIAALGATVAIVAGHGPHGPGFLLDQPGFYVPRCCESSRSRAAAVGHIPQEAFIGIDITPWASAARDPSDEQGYGETDDLKDMLVGNILAVSWAK